jgi:DNA-binding beta-propeller fold protein YncE
MKRLIAVCALGCASMMLAQTPQATELPGKPYFIKKTWHIGGEGNWDYLTLDASAQQLFIPHGPVVQVVALETGVVAGEVKGLHEAHNVALDDGGQFGYVTDGPGNEVAIFDRRSFEVIARVPTGKNPRAIVFEPASRLVFVICPDATPDSRIPRRTSARLQPDPSIQSVVTVIDSVSQKRIADMLFPGKLGFAQAGSNGSVYVNVTDRNQIAVFKATAIEPQLHQLAARGDTLLTIDWTDGPHPEPPLPRRLQFIRLGTECQSPRGLAIDGHDDRLFAACDNMKMVVLDATNGQITASLPIGAGNDAIAYDPDRGMIYASNGGGVGSLTIIRQHLTDSYAVVQELPTQARARTMAVNPQTGEVYLVTNVLGLDLTKPGTGGSAHTLPSVQTSAVKGSFEVLVIGN